MITEVSFLHAIRDAPADDDLLLVFADWLDEHEDARAASIRAMVAWTRRAEDDPARDDDETRFKTLCHDAAEAWLGPLHKRVISWCVVGGLLQIRARARAIYRLLDDPEARRVFGRVGLLDLVGEVEVVRALLALPDWLTLSTLDLGCNGADSTLVLPQP